MTKHYILSNFLKASKTFALYNDIFFDYKLQHTYKPIEIKTKKASVVSEEELTTLDQFFKDFKEDLDAKSIVISNPFKQIVPKYCDNLIDQANEMQAVNLITKSNGKIIGQNIDGEAFLMGQKHIYDIKFSNKTILILGCGGVSTAVSFIIAKQLPLKLILFDIDDSKIAQLMYKLTKSFPHLNVSFIVSEKEIINIEPDIIYNGTGIGKSSDNPDSLSQTPLTNFPMSSTCIDANYTPWKTEFLKLAEQKNCQIVNGFTHMIAFTTLHLNQVLEQEIAFDYVYEKGLELVNSDH